MERKTNIQVKKSTRDALAALGSKDDSYDDIIRRIIHQRNILAIHEVCKDMEDYDKGIIMNVFDTIGYTIPLTYTSYENGKPYKCDWVTEERAINWAMEMATDEDLVGSARESVPVSEKITNVYCLLEEIPAPTWAMSVRMKNPFKF